jgi:hypothetical protein
MGTVLRNISICIFSLISISGCTTSVNSVDLPIQKKEISTFNTVISDVVRINEKYGPANVLIVLDIDNTLLTSSVDIGGDIWYQWQRGNLEVKPSEAQKVKCLFEDSIGLLYELGTMNLTEEMLPTVLSDWQSAGNTLMALTSRAPKYRAATERELHNKGFDFNITALAPVGKKTPVYREMADRELSYMNGIMMTSGMNKGEMLSYLLEKTNRNFAAIVFVDDSKKNIDNVYNKYVGRKDIDVKLYHYLKVERDREAKYGSILTEEKAEKMASDWNNLNQTLNSIFPKRNRQRGCLSTN